MLYQLFLNIVSIWDNYGAESSAKGGKGVHRNAKVNSLSLSRRLMSYMSNFRG